METEWQEKWKQAMAREMETGETTPNVDSMQNLI
jgi:hypothetical protein